MKIHVQKKEFWLLQIYQLSRLVKWVANNVLVVVSVFLFTFIFYCGMRELFRYLQASDEQVKTIYSKMITIAEGAVMLIILVMAFGIVFANLLSNRDISFTKILKVVWIYVLGVISFYYFTLISSENKFLWIEQTLICTVWIIFLIIVLTSVVQKIFLWWLRRNVFVQSIHDIQNYENIDVEHLHECPHNFIQVKEEWAKYIRLKSSVLSDEFVYELCNQRKVFLIYEIRYISTVINISQESVCVKKRI